LLLLPFQSEISNFKFEILFPEIFRLRQQVTPIPPFPPKPMRSAGQPGKRETESSQQNRQGIKEDQTLTRRRTLTLLVVVAHWIVAIGHLFLAAKVLPPPNNSVSWLAVTLITLGHLAVSIALWTLSDKLAGLLSLFFFLAALGADLYEHFLHASANNVFMVAPGDWTARFDASVFVLLALEIVGCLLGILLLGGRTRNNAPPQFDISVPHFTSKRDVS
jgi:hypothetical protein